MARRTKLQHLVGGVWRPGFGLDETAGDGGGIITTYSLLFPYPCLLPIIHRQHGS
jgi:hypothetical protein